MDDLLQETYSRKNALNEANQDYLDRYMEVFIEKVDQAK